MSDDSFNLAPHVREQAQLIKASWPWETAPANASGITGPALVYTTPALSVCGARHNMEAVRKAAFQLGVPLYVILTANDTTLDRIMDPKRPNIPGQTKEQLITSQQDALLPKYQLLPSDTVIRLVGKNGELVHMPDVSIPTKDASTDQGVHSLINAFRGSITNMCRTSPTPSCGRNGR